MIIWKLFQIIFTTLAGLIVPARVVIPESTLTPPPEVLVAYQEQEVVSPESLIPEYLQIPSINVNAAVDPVGLTEKGAVGTPIEPELLGWFDESVPPGELGTAIIDGHRGWRDGLDAVFDNLNQITVGDVVIIMNSAGETIPFEVYDKKTYLPNESPKEVFISSEEGSFLNLITCNGEWDTEAHTATERLVVFTKRIDQ
jgi:sortase A